MKIYIWHSQEFNFQEELYTPMRDSKLNLEYEILLPHEIPWESDFVTKNIIENCDVMIAEVSFPSTGLGIELGWANSFERPIIGIYNKWAKVSSSLKMVCNALIEYTDKNNLIEVLEKSLSELRKEDTLPWYAAQRGKRIGEGVYWEF